MRQSCFLKINLGILYVINKRMMILILDVIFPKMGMEKLKVDSLQFKTAIHERYRFRQSYVCSGKFSLKKVNIDIRNIPR